MSKIREIKICEPQKLESVDARSFSAASKPNRIKKSFSNFPRIYDGETWIYLNSETTLRIGPSHFSYWFSVTIGLWIYAKSKHTIELVFIFEPTHIDVCECVRGTYDSLGTRSRAIRHIRKNETKKKKKIWKKNRVISNEEKRLQLRVCRSHNNVRHDRRNIVCYAM